ncbi:MAG: DEAD/DEAH box helicase family protein [Muribaculaceae bacterium]|nr:DEAD/DEAH box helicase family protein [Muribaculaceae bacterium]
MELKNYQHQTLRDLDDYIHVLNESNSLSEAFSRYWEECRGVSFQRIDSNYLRPYSNTVRNVPRVTLKVPTAGGKTFIACNAIGRIFQSLQIGDFPKVVAWFVPSDTILKQTLEKLQNPAHPYRQAIDALFNHKVTVVDKEAALQGNGLKPEQLQSELVILVLSAQSFVETVKAKKDVSSEQNKPKAYRENENFFEQSKHYPHPDKLIAGTDPTALIQVIAQQNPVVIVDESHNFRTNLRDEMLANLNPRFILELTATPRDKSNIVSFVDAMQLKKENMVKLPVIVENRNSPRDVLSAAIRMRNSLEKLAKENEANGGRYIRPIVLFQAQPKTDEDNVTFDKIKQQLIDVGIPENQIKIKTANKDELKGIDLMSRDCEVRYIITVNALKEGWDCPFAYILATLANKTSKVDVEQILGRILRQPYTNQHGISLLNLSYVFTSSNDFRNTIDGIIRSLQKVGFSRKDFRDVTPEPVEIPTPQPQPTSKPLFPVQPEEIKDEGSEVKDELELDINDVEEFKNELTTENVASDIQQLQQQAIQVSDEYTQIIEQQSDKGDIDPLASITPQEMYYPINEQFGEVAINMNLPIFFIKTPHSVFFSDEEWIQLEKSMLSEGFDLSTKDAEIDFTIIRPDGITIDVADSGDAVRKNNQSLTNFIRNQYVDKTASTKKAVLIGQIAGMIKLDAIPEPQLKEYVKRAIERLDADQIENLIDNIYLTRDAIKGKIESLLRNHRRKIFSKWLTTGKIKLKGHYTFIDKITLRDELVGIDKGLYAAEENVNGFEYDAIAAIAEHPNVLFWHRNRDRNEFGINGFINHYPDFIVRMKSGVTLLIETKGDHLDNTESEEKRWLGNKWADLAGDNFKYFMVFQSKEVDGAITLKTLLQLLDEL